MVVGGYAGDKSEIHKSVKASGDGVKDSGWAGGLPGLWQTQVREW